MFIVAQGVGAVISGPIAAAAMRRIGEVPLIGTALAIFAAGSLLLVVASLPLVLAGSLLIGFSLPWLVIGFNTLLQRRTPERLMGRVSSAADLLVGTPQTISIAVGAALISVIDYRIMLLTIAAVAALYLTTRRERPEASSLQLMAHDGERLEVGQVDELHRADPTVQQSS